MSRFLILLSAFICLSHANAFEPWPQFRGPLGNGVANADNIPAEFGEDNNLKWKTELPGRGWSSPVMANGRIWLTTAVEVFPTEEERIDILTKAGEDAKKFAVRQVAKSIRLGLQEVDFETGKLLREVALDEIESPETIHSLNSFASPTPVLDQGKIYAHFGTFGTFCVDTESAEIVWKKRLPLEHSVGPGSSPFIYEDLLVLICDGVDKQYVTALRKTNGEEVWKTDRPEMRAPLGDQKKSYCTPIVVTPKGKTPQLICMGSQWLVSYDPDSGEEIWRLDHGDGFSVVPRPVFSEKHQLLFLSTGFGKPVLLAVKVDGSGDITGKDMIAWQEPKRIPAKPSFLIDGDELYAIADGGIGSCFDAATGEVLWTERIDGNYSASPLLADGKIFFCSQEGRVTVIRPGRNFELIQINQLNEDEMIMASPVAVDGSLIVRSKGALYRFSQ